MRSHWEALRAGLLRSIEGRDARLAFDQLRRDFEGLRGYATPADLVEAIAGSQDLETKGTVLEALVRATRDARSRRQAQELLLLCLWPALDGLFLRHLRFFRQRPQDLVSELAVHFALAVSRIDLRRVTCLTATLVRNTERCLVYHHRLERMTAALSDELTPESAVSAAPDPATLEFRPRKGEPDVEPTVAIRAWLERAIGAEADLVMDAIIYGKSRTEIAAALGVSHCAARKRVQRALFKARQAFLAGDQSQTALATALAN
jgi:RNA polymerase sigma-70 factor (ECF subfamily)